jgi:hypothetical protein
MVLGLAVAAGPMSTFGKRFAERERPMVVVSCRSQKGGWPTPARLPWHR